MSKSDFIAAHEAAVDRYLEDHPTVSWARAYELTADQAFDDMGEMMADRIDAARDRMKEHGQ